MLRGHHAVTVSSVHEFSPEPIGVVPSSKWQWLAIALWRALECSARYCRELRRRRNFTLAKLGRHCDCTLNSVELYPDLRPEMGANRPSSIFICPRAIIDTRCQKEATLLRDESAGNAEEHLVGNVSLYEDISDRQNENATNVVVSRGKLTSIKHLPDGPGARVPRVRFNIATLWEEFGEVVQALDACNSRQLPTERRKRWKGMIDKAVEGSWLRERLRKSMAKLIQAYPSGHPVRATLKRGLRQMS